MRKLCLLLLCSITPFKVSSQPGSLDSTFGNNGIQTTAIESNLNLLNEQGRVVLTSVNGNIFVVGQVDYDYSGIVRYLPDGRLDSSYGDAGCSNSVSLNVISAAMQGNKIVGAGWVTQTIPGGTTTDFALVRYTADGRLDSSFGVSGIITTDFNNSEDGANAIALWGDKIVAVGSASRSYNNSDFAIARYKANGSLDSSFGVNGKVLTDFHGVGSDNATSVALQGDKIIVAGNTWNPADENRDFVLARYTVDGRLDTTFGVNGIVTTGIRASSIAMQGDKIIVAESNGDYVLTRYTADGALDASFGMDGKVTTDFDSSDDRATSIALQGDKILVAGDTYNLVSDNTDFALACYTLNGVLDSSFGENGKATTDFNSPFDFTYSIALQGNKIIPDNAVGLSGKT